MTNDYQQERLAKMMGQMPQYEGQGYDDVIATVDFTVSDHPNPKKARKKNIKMAIKALKPLKRPLFFLGYRRQKGHQCVCDGTNCINADYGDLFDTHFRDPYTKEIRPFRPWTGVVPGKGRQMSGTYCPQHMKLYDNLLEWLEVEEAEADPGFFTRMAKKGVAFVPIKKSEKKAEHPLIVKYTQVFIEAQKDGLPILHYSNPITGENDITMLVFDARVLALTMPTGTTLSTAEMQNYQNTAEQV